MRYLLLIPVIIYVSASLWANFDLFPEGFMEYWWFDDLGHIVIFGSLALVALTIAHKRNTSVVFAFTAVTTLAVADEFSQLFLTHRAFSYQDVVMSLVGIVLAFCAFLLSRKVFLK